MTSLLQQELEPLKAQIEQVRKKLSALEADLGRAEALETVPHDTTHYAALQEVCDALDRLTELEAAELFWKPLAEHDDAARHRERLQERISGFAEHIRSAKKQQVTIKAQIAARNNELDLLFEQVHDAYAREQHRLEQLVVEREVSAVPERVGTMPWSSDSLNEKAFRHAMTVALLIALVIGSIMHWVTVPEETSISVEIPERLARLVRPEPPKVKEKPVVEPKPAEPTEAETEVAAKPDETKAARAKAEESGVLAFKNAFEGLVDDAPVAGLGSRARLRKGGGNGRSSGSANTARSLVAIQGKSGSGGIGAATIRRNIGSGTKGNADRIGSVGFSRVESSVAELQAEAGRKVSDEPGPARTDEEIQIVFDRYKATLYRIYNKKLRRDPTLRGKILLRITIEPEGTVSSCSVEKTDLASTELVDQIVERVSRFNFGPKEGVQETTILYPIDFLPAG